MKVDEAARTRYNLAKITLTKKKTQLSRVFFNHRFHLSASGVFVGAQKCLEFANRYLHVKELLLECRSKTINLALVVWTNDSAFWVCPSLELFKISEFFRFFLFYWIVSSGLKCFYTVSNSEELREVNEFRRIQRNSNEFKWFKNNSK